MNKHDDQANSYERKHRIGGLISILKGLDHDQNLKGLVHDHHGKKQKGMVLEQ